MNYSKFCLIERTYDDPDPIYDSVNQVRDKLFKKPNGEFSEEETILKELYDPNRDIIIADNTRQVYQENLSKKTLLILGLMHLPGVLKR